MATGFIRNEQEFTPYVSTAPEEDADLETMWEDALKPSSVERRIASEEIRRLRGWW